MIFLAVPPVEANVLSERETELARQAHERLFEVADECNGWVSVHAAEALIKLGLADNLRDRYIECALDLEAINHRVGVLRVLSLLAESSEEREHYVSQLREIFAVKKNTDRRQALEALCKLGVLPSRAILSELKRISVDGESAEGVYALWSLTLANDSEARNSLVSKLESNDSDIRRRAAYALRWIAPRDPVILKKILQARSRELNPSAKIYMTCAVIGIVRNSEPAKEYHEYLWRVLESANDRDKYEILQTLMFCIDVDQLEILQGVSFSRGDPEIAALWSTIHVLKSRL